MGSDLLSSTKKIGIVGLGLIGGSLGLDLKKCGYTIHGLTHREETVRRAKERGLAHEISTDPIILEDCSIVFLALPLAQLLQPDKKLIAALPVNAVVTDVGSVKEPVLQLWKNLHSRFVASHPMAGTDKSGVESGQENLFNGKPWVVTPDKSTDAAAIEQVKEIALSIGSLWMTSEPRIHDQAVALISHLPVFVSAALLRTIENDENISLKKLSKELASSGFLDTTRVGGGNPELGLAMAKHNNSEVLRSLASFRRSLDFLEETIRSKQWENLIDELEQAKANRSEYSNNVF